MISEEAKSCTAAPLRNLSGHQSWWREIALPRRSGTSSGSGAYRGLYGPFKHVLLYDSNVSSIPSNEYIPTTFLLNPDCSPRQPGSPAAASLVSSIIFNLNQFNWYCSAGQTWQMCGTLIALRSFQKAKPVSSTICNTAQVWVAEWPMLIGKESRDNLRSTIGCTRNACHKDHLLPIVTNLHMQLSTLNDASGFKEIAHINIGMFHSRISESLEEE